MKCNDKHVYGIDWTVSSALFMEILVFDHAGVELHLRLWGRIPNRFRKQKLIGADVIMHANCGEYVVCRSPVAASLLMG